MRTAEAASYIPPFDSFQQNSPALSERQYPTRSHAIAEVAAAIMPFYFAKTEGD